MFEEELNTEFIVCDEEAVGKRIDTYISEKLGISRAKAQKFIELESVLLGGKKVSKNRILNLNDEIEIIFPENQEIDAKPQDIPLDIIYEDNDIIVVNKPQSMVVHPAPGNYDNTLVNALLYHCKDSLSGINGKIRPGIVHRIDKDTSGLLVCAKNDVAHIKLAEMISKHDFTRKYVAILHGTPKDDSGIIETAIGRSQKDRKKMAVYPIDTKNTKNAITKYRVLEKFVGYSFVEFTLETGRTHQIRVHSLSMGCPVIGDPVYAKRSIPFNLSGQCLHAKVLGFRHPITGKDLFFEAPLPEYFEKTLEILHRKYKING